MSTKKRDPKSMMVMRCDEQYALRLRAKLQQVFGDKVSDFYSAIPDTKLVALRISFPESMAEGVIACAKRWIEERAPDGKELVVSERGRR
jgi:hypothetical protein